ncbi:fibronectin type III domain-containing protein [Limosilactobacillus ingluviei]|nr:fibronectin type III domain-containing protein [Limosilactobacillus ingluviei]
MATYGMKDAFDLVLVKRGTKEVVFRADYANTTQVEWKADRVFAKKKGANAIAFDAARTSEMTVETEIIDFRLMALLAGKEAKRGADSVFKTEKFTLTNDRQIKLENVPEAGSVSVFRLNKDGITHDQAIPQQVNGEATSVPVMVENVSVSAKDTTAAITWGASANADSYVVYRDNVQIGQPTQTSFNDSDLTPEKTYKYKVVAVNKNGASAPSAEVVVTTATAGTQQAGEAVKATSEAIEAAKKVAEVVNANGLNFTLKENGLIQLSEAAVAGADYVVYYTTQLDGLTSFSIDANTFAENYEIYAESYVVERETGDRHFIQVHYPNVKPQGNFNFNQNSKEPTSLSIKFDLLPDENDHMANYKIVED